MGIFAPGRWRLVCAELGIRLDGEAHERDVTIEMPTNVTTTAALNAPEPGTMPGTSEARRLSIVTEFWAQHNQDNIWPKAEALTKLVSWTKQLGRRPLVELSWGPVSVEGWLSVDLSLAEGQFETPPYNIRCFRAALAVTKAFQAQLSAATGSRAVPETRYDRIGEFDSFETVAMRHLGDPMLGILLRRINTQLSANGEGPGDHVKVLERNHPSMEESLAPLAPCFVGDYRGYLQEIAEDKYETYGPGLEALEAELGL